MGDHHGGPSWGTIMGGGGNEHTVTMDSRNSPVHVCFDSSECGLLDSLLYPVGTQLTVSHVCEQSACVGFEGSTLVPQHTVGQQCQATTRTHRIAVSLHIMPGTLLHRHSDRLPVTLRSTLRSKNHTVASPASPVPDRSTMLPPAAGPDRGATEAMPGG
jgi:hypothetical protein